MNKNRTGALCRPIPILINWALLLGAIAFSPFVAAQTISGTVTDGTTTNPIGNAGPICVTELDGTHVHCFGTEANGTYESQVLDPRDYIVDAEPDGFIAESVVVTVASTNVSGIDFALQPGWTISGTVTDATTTNPIGNAGPICVRLGATNVECFGTEANGTYESPEVLAGNYFVDAEPDGFVVETVTVMVPSADVSGINFALQPGWTISGIITEFATGNPIGNAGPICVRLGATNVECFGTEANGTYESPAVLAGNYFVDAEPDGFVADTVTVMVPSADVSGINFALKGAVDSDGDGVVNDVDFCPDTIIPESVPVVGLKPTHWALMDGDFEFDTVIKGRGRGPNQSYTTADTAGCSCEQIIDAQGLGRAHTQFGCSTSTMDAWVELITP